ncbi:vegetative incompatibility protein HET-E-1, partial [Rhizoctonia solani 123E]
MHALHPLRSVLHQSEETGLVSTLHASFPDFMFSYERSGTYFYDVVEHSQLLARRCFLVMKYQLRFNICNLASSFVPDKEVENIEKRIKTSISPTLAYACRYWTSHLALAPQASVLLTLLDEFLCHRLLFWMEVLCLRRELSAGVDGLLKAQQWLMVTQFQHTEISSINLVHCVDEARSFVTSFAVNPTSQCTPHIYISSLSLCPRSSTVYQHYGSRTRGLLELQGSLVDVREGAPLAVWNVNFQINSLALSPDGTRVVIGSYDTTVRILSAYDSAPLVGPLSGHTSSVISVAFSSDGSRIVSASRDGIRVWNAYNGTLIIGPFRELMGLIGSVAFSPDGARVVSGSRDGTVRIWNAHDGTPMFEPLPGHLDLVYHVIFSPNGAYVAASSSLRTIQLWNSVDGAPTGPPFKGHTGSVNCLAFTPDNTQLVSGSSDQTIRVWNIPNGSLATHPFEGHASSIESVAVSPDGTRVVSSSTSTVLLWKIDDGTLVAGPFYGPTVSLNSLAYSPDGTRVIYAGLGHICVRNMRDGMFPPPPSPLQGDIIIGIKYVTFRPDSTHFLSTGRENTIR